MAKTPKIRFKNFSDEWNAKILGEICEYKNGKSYEPFICDNGKYNLITLNSIDINGKLKIEHKKILNADEFLIKDDLVIVLSDIAIGSFLGLTAIIPNNNTYVLNQRMGLLRKTINLNAYFLSTLINSKQKYFFSIGQGTSQKNLSKFGVLNLSIKIPKNIKEQEKIGAFFSKLDKLITLHQSKFEKLQKIKKSCLQNLFPKNNQNTPKIRFKNFTDEWVENRLGGIANIINRKDENSTAPVMMISASSGFINQSIKYSTDNAGQSLAKYIILKKHELAYNHGASKYRPYGSCFELQVNEARIPFVYHCFKLINDNSTFMALQLNNPNIDKQLRKLVSSGARMDGLLNISYEDYMSIEILIPNLEEQEKIGAFFSKLDKLITLHQSKFKKLQKIKKSCLQNMFV